jgi:hypothetical protein
MHRRVLAAVLMLLTLHPGARAAPEPAADESVAERRVKAAYLYRFIGYAEWPEGAFAAPAAPLVIGIWGNDPLADDLAHLVAGRTVDGRPLEVRRVRDADPLAGVHLLFAARDRTGRLGDASAAAPSRPVLLVTESASGARAGSAINFLIVDGQLRFDVSPGAAERRGLKLSSRLVAVSNNLAGKAR